MSRRAISSSPWSFLDTLSGALGAILFLFIIVDKGGGQESMPPIKGNFPKAYLSLDTMNQELHGELPDSLMRLQPGEKLVIVVDAVSPKPVVASVLPEPCKCDPCPTATRTLIPIKECTRQHFKYSNEKCPDPSHHLVKVCPDPNTHTKVLCDDPKCEKTITKVVESTVITLPFQAVFMLESDNFEDELDLRVCKNGKCVDGGKKRNKETGLVWLNYKISGFGTAKTGSEVIILEEKDKMAGVFTIQGRLSRRQSATVNLKFTASTKKDYEKISKKVPPSDDWATFGKIKVDARGNITKL